MTETRGATAPSLTSVGPLPRGEEKGTGLGLWISRGIIQKYEGTIRFRSIALAGRNATCFSVFIPTSAATEPTAIAALVA